MHDNFNHIKTDYSSYRQRFLQAAERRGASLTHIQHPLKGMHGESLYTDVAILAEPGTRKWMLSVSGTHGVEGYYGSMCQTQYLDHIAKQPLPPRTGLIMVHLINPWGTSWKRRVNENNIDLNRNFIDFDQTLPVNQVYETLHDCFRTDTVNGEQSGLAQELWQEKVNELGQIATTSHVEAGQYCHEDGLYFGGFEPSWSNRVLRKIIRDNLSDSTNVISFDLHTGAGQYGHPMLMAIAEQTYPGIENAERVYGEWLYTVLTGADKTTDTGISAAATGYVSKAMVDMMQNKRLMQLVIECGTYNPSDFFEHPVIDDHFLHARKELQGPEFNRVKKDLTEFFYPGDPDWRELVWVRTRQIFDQALAELATQ